MLKTHRLEILPSSIEQLDLIVAGNWPALSASLGGVRLAEHWYHFPEAFAWMLEYLRRHPDEVKWWNYLIVHRTEHCLVGSCGYKGGPSREGEIEIGYEIAEAYWGQGLATEAAGALVDFALRQPTVKMVIAHTYARENPSCSVLRKLGFQKAAELYDPDDGTIWKWEKKR